MGERQGSVFVVSGWRLEREREGVFTLESNKSSSCFHSTSMSCCISSAFEEFQLSELFLLAG